MPKPNLSAMSVDALLKLRDDINKVLDRKANELRSQLSRLGVASVRRKQAGPLKRSRRNIVAHQVRPGPVEEQGPSGWLRR